jgi:uncharacterized protein YdhG (YjbR/CyaY superfamily)
MDRMKTNLKTIKTYIAVYPKETQVVLKKIYELIHSLVPSAEEKISYGIPTFKLKGKNLVHFAAYAHHIGFYPGSEAIGVFEDELKGYVLSKGTVQFQLDEPIPYEMITKITKFRIKVVEQEALTKKK